MDSNRRHLLAGAAALGLARITPAWAQAGVMLSLIHI